MKTAYINGKIYCDRDYFASVMIVEDGKIRSVSDTLDTSFTGNLVDLGGKTVLPGFHDAHLHLLMTAKLVKQADLSHTKSYHDIKEAFEDYQDLDLLQGWGYDEHDNQIQRLLNRHDLDQISQAKAVIIHRVCLHKLMLNTFALQQIGWLDQIEEIYQDYIELDEHKIPTGIVHEEAAFYASSFFNRLKEEELNTMIYAMMKKLLAQGITTAHINDLDFTRSEDLVLDKVYKKLSEKSPILRIVHQVMLNDEALEKLKPGPVNPYLSYHSMKLFADGSLGARTAWLKQSYEDEAKSYGLSLHSDAKLLELVRKAHDKGWDVLIHAIGDAAFAQVLNTFKTVNQENPRQHRIVHAQVLDEKAIPALKQNKNISVTAQAIFINDDYPLALTKLGRKRLEKSYAFAEMIRSGIDISLSSDAPIASFNVMHGIHCLVNNTTLDHIPFNHFEGSSISEAIDAYTLSGARQAHLEKRSGRLLKGYDADFIILDRDIFEIDSKEIKDIKILESFVAGKSVYRL